MALFLGMRLYKIVLWKGRMINFEKIVLPIFNRKNVTVSLRMYANDKHQEFAKFIRSLKQMNTDYILVADKNSEQTCITAKKENVQKCYENEVEKDKIIVVVKEIESWYLSGLVEEQAKKLDLPLLENTESVGKKKFDEYRRNCRIPNRKHLLKEILKYFSIKTAKQKNASFKYFADKYQL
jgi:uncharacterized protein YdcH (DUF465 family)